MVGSEQAGGRDRKLMSPAPQPQPLIIYHTNAFSFNDVYRPCNTSTATTRLLPFTSTQILPPLLPDDDASVEQDSALDDVCGIQDLWGKIALSLPETCSKLQRLPINKDEWASTSIDDAASPQNPRKAPDANSLRHEFQVPHGLAALEFRGFEARLDGMRKSHLKEISKACEVKIKEMDGEPGWFCIEGLNARAVLDARICVESFIQSWIVHHKVFLMPNDAVPSFFGRQKSFLKAFQRKYNVLVRMTKKEVGATTELIVKGDCGSMLSLAMKSLDEWMEDWMGVANPTFSVPDEALRHFFGRRKIHKNSIESAYNVKILQMRNRSRNKRGSRLFSIEGENTDNIYRAKKEIEEWLKRWDTMQPRNELSEKRSTSSSPTGNSRATQVKRTLIMSRCLCMCVLVCIFCALLCSIP